ncbi:MAG: DUF2961 domain-containing protein [Sedimentisphaerales bacterium]|nr:DUF2961 domain-containing protein [Sedimentisphaerales bacterium]
MSNFNGLGLNMGNLSWLSDAESRSISPENKTGSKNAGGLAKEGSSSPAARDLGAGWKVNPREFVQPGETLTLADIRGSGAIQQIWMTVTGNWRFSILRMYWDNQEHPSVECPVGDFFACGWGKYAQVSSLAVCVNPGSAFNCYWEMPFRKRARITLTNIDTEQIVAYYQINYTLTDVPEQCAYFHAQYRRTNPLPCKEVYTIAEGIEGKGQYVGTYMAWGSNNNGWWGEGEIKFYLDGDEHPTICGTGTEDYFCGSYNFESDIAPPFSPAPKGAQSPGRVDATRRGYREFTTPYAGLPQVLRPDGLYQSQQRFGLYRWHIADPIRFRENLRVTIQALGWRHDRRYLPLQDDIASVAYWYQTLPSSPFPPLPEKDYLEII